LGASVVVGDLADVHSQKFLRKHDDEITCLEVSPSGKYIASGQKGNESNVYIWDFESGKAIYGFEEFDQSVVSVGFSMDERMLVTLGGEEPGRQMYIYDLSNGMIVATVSKLPAGTVTAVFGGFIKDIKRRDTERYTLCSGGTSGLTLWDLDPYSGDIDAVSLKGDARATVKRSYTAVAYSIDGETILGASESGDLQIVSAKAERIVSSVACCRKGLLTLRTFAGGVVVGGGDCSLKLLNMNMDVVAETALDGAVLSLSLSPDGLEALAATSTGSVFRVNLVTMQHILFSESHSAAVTAVAFPSNNSDIFATGSDDGSIKVWDALEYVVIATAKALRSSPVGTKPVCLAFSDVVLSGWNDGRILAHDPYSGENLWMIDNAHETCVTALCVSHNNRFIVTGGIHGEVRLWELRSRDLISHLKEHVGRVNSVVISEDDTHCFSASRDRCALRWSLRHEKRTFCHMQRMGGLNCIILSKDESHLLTCGQERCLTFWNVSQENSVHRVELDGDNDEAFALAKSPDGSLLATGGSAGILRLFSYESGKCLAVKTGHSRPIRALAFSPDARQVISTGEDRAIFIWNIFKD
jgi:WD40 repeat protein